MLFRTKSEYWETVSSCVLAIKFAKPSIISVLAKASSISLANVTTSSSSSGSFSTCLLHLRQTAVQFFVMLWVALETYYCRFSRSFFLSRGSF